MTLRINVLRYNGFVFRAIAFLVRKKLDPIPSASGSYGRLAGR